MALDNIHRKHKWSKWSRNSYRAGTVRSESRHCYICGAGETKNRIHLFGHDYWVVEKLRLVFPNKDLEKLYRKEQEDFDKGIRYTTFEEMYPKMKKDDPDIMYNGISIWKTVDPKKPCWNCGVLTSFVDISFEAYICSEHCEDIKWEEFVISYNNNMEKNNEHSRN